jgi:hypothetical protein
MFDAKPVFLTPARRNGRVVAVGVQENQNSGIIGKAGDLDSSYYLSEHLHGLPYFGAEEIA